MYHYDTMSVAASNTGCMPIDKAEQKINSYACEQRNRLELAYARHASERCQERDIKTSDIFYVLAKGYIIDEPEKSSRPRVLQIQNKLQDT